jgi:DNA-binding NtrC family response regulator
VKDLNLETEPPALTAGLSPEIFELSFKDAKDRMIQAFHLQYIKAILGRSGGNISKAAEAAGIQRQYLHRLMKESGIEGEAFKIKDE